MKHKIYSTLLIAFAFTALGFTSVSAATETTTANSVETTSVAIETTTAEETTNNILDIDSTNDNDSAIDISKSIKVKKKIKLKNSLAVDSSTLKSLSFTADDSSVVKVSNTGVVTGIAPGTATVTVTAPDATVYATVNVNVKNSYTESQLRYMSSIIYSEAVGEPYAGKLAVGIVVMNRIQSSLFPNTIKSVLYQKYQFTPTVNGSLNRSLALYDAGAMDKSCIAAAKEALNGIKVVNYKGSNLKLGNCLFFSRYIPKRRFKIAHHMFK